MEVSSLQSAANKPRANCHIPVKKAAVASAHAPNIAIPLRFIVTALLAIAVGFLILTLNPHLLSTYHYGPQIIAVTHLFVLGWLCSLIMGAMYQLVPVALETKLYSERFARWHYLLHVIGFIGMVWQFWDWNLKQVGHYGSALAIGAFIFIYNLARTIARVPKWNVVAFGIASALFWLFMVMIAGLFVVSAKCWPQISPFVPLAQMHAHGHLGVLGFFLMMLVAVSYKLLPMFGLSEIQNQRRAWASIILLNVALAGLFPAILLGSRWKFEFGHLVAVALVLYGFEINAILKARKRRVLDWGLKTFLAGVWTLIPLTATGLILTWPGLPFNERTGQLENVYGELAILGVLTLAILGMLYKIIPFLVWYAAYSEWVGRCAVPSLSDLYQQRWQIAGFWTFIPGIFSLCVSTLLGYEKGVFLSWLLLDASLLCFFINAAIMFSHLLWPKIKTEPAQTVKTGLLFNALR